MSIVINGGGITGLILALKLVQLTQNKLRIFLIEQNSFCSSYMSNFIENPSALALSRGAYFELLKIDNVYSILSGYSTIIDKLEISSCYGFNKVFIKAQDYQLLELGYVIKLYPIKKLLFHLLYKQPGIIVRCPAKIKYMECYKSHNVIILDNNEQIITKLLIAADGACSKLSSFYGIKMLKKNYYQTAIVTEVYTEIPNHNQAFERFTPIGPLVFLPIANNISFIIWCVSNQKKKEILEWNKKKFIRELQDLFGWKLGKILDMKALYFYDLSLVYAKNHIAHRLALIGSAAQKLHPIAGQGLNLGIRDVITLSNIIYREFFNNNDIGSSSILYEYQQLRRLDQHKIIMITDYLIRLVGSNYFTSIFIRNLGLFFIERSAFLKHWFISQALYWKLN